MELEKYSMGIGDRLFGYECAAQLKALKKAESQGVLITPVWNKSNREHVLAGTVPEDARRAADAAVQQCRWDHHYYVDADHVGMKNVGEFIPCSDFFTIEASEAIGKPANERQAASFALAMAQFRGRLEIPGMEPPIEISDSTLADFAQRYLRAVEEAGRTYRYIAETKGTADFISEVSIDEANAPQTPVELFLILAAIAHAKIPIQTIAPKFTGSFLKGVDYVGDARQFDREFKDDLAVIAFAVKTFGLPKNLKLSVHTGSDKFSLYPLMRQAITAVDAGIHLKTAGTTWLEEAVGIASCGGEGLQLAKDIYRESHCRFEELAKPYLAVISIDARRLPLPAAVDGWSADDFVHTLKHDESCAAYNSDFRQLMHIGFRIAAEMKPRFIKMLLECRDVIEEHVTSNLYENHIRRLYPGIQ